MKKLIISGLGLMMVFMLAIPAMAGTGKRGNGFGNKRPNHSWRNSDYTRREYKQDLNRERRQFQCERKENRHALRKADTPREKHWVRREMRADRKDYRHGAHQIKRNFRQQYHSSATGFKCYEKRPLYRHPVRKSHHNSSYLAFGMWF